MPQPPCSPDLTPSNFSFPWMKTVLKGDVEEGKQKTGEALKGIKIDKFKHCSEQQKNVSIGVLHHMESTLKVTEV